jgi:hypothetical protein
MGSTRYGTVFCHLKTANIFLFHYVQVALIKGLSIVNQASQLNFFHIETMSHYHFSQSHPPPSERNAPHPSPPPPQCIVTPFSIPFFDGCSFSAEQPPPP